MHFWKNLRKIFFILLFFLLQMGKRIILSILLNAFTLFLVQVLLGKDSFFIDPIWGFFAVGAVMGILNGLIKPLLALLSLPFILITFGLFLSIINILLLFLNEYLFREILTIGVVFTISGGFWTYLFASILISTINGIMHFFLRVR